jgi:hypothetical protein
LAPAILDVREVGEPQEEGLMKQIGKISLSEEPRLSNQ